ncbi:MAG: hypothetical protein HUK22_03665, partial [Thermoguttaceae bacterium]|nr:hypothetical protein [Thermoguttaceae bacterium]
SVGLYREANSLAVVAMALGASEDDSPLKVAAEPLIAAAQQAAGAKNLAEAKTALKAVIEARAAKNGATPLEWKKVATLKPLMKNAVPALSTEIKRLGRNEKTLTRGKNAQKVLDNAAILATIAVGCRDNVTETLAPKEEKLWLEYCARFHAAAIDYSDKIEAAAKGGDFEEAAAAFKVLESTCNATCHEKFGGQTAE